MGISELFKKEKTPPRCSAVIVAAGASRRMGEDKTLMSLGGKPVLVRTLMAFEQCESVEEIVVVTQREKIEEIADLCKSQPLTKVSKVIAGGATRTESSLAGVSEVKPEAELIAIHDGARPFITPELITKTVEAASKHKAAAPALRSTDTLKAVDKNGFILGTVDRETTVRIQTPQVFDAVLIKRLAFVGDGPVCILVEVGEEAVRRGRQLYSGDKNAVGIGEKVAENARAAEDDRLVIARRGNGFFDRVYHLGALNVDILPRHDDVAAVFKRPAAGKIGQRAPPDDDRPAAGERHEMCAVGPEHHLLCALGTDAPIGKYCNDRVHNASLNESL